MFRLLAFHNGRRLDREFLLVDGNTYVLGRGDDVNLHADWDERISRRHVELHPEVNGVMLRKLADTSNSVFVDGMDVSEANLASGDAFVIGSTRFEVQQMTQSDSPGRQPIQQLAIDRQQLQRVRYDDAAKRIEVLTSLPAVIRESGVERDLHIRLASLLLAGVQNVLLSSDFLTHSGLACFIRSSDSKRVCSCSPACV